MFEVRIHGRGGQGVRTAARLLSLAACLDGYHAQAIPGDVVSARRGTPVAAGCRIDEDALHDREPVLTPDAIVIQDPTLLRHFDLFSGLDEEAYVLIDSSRSPSELGLDEMIARRGRAHVQSIPATAISRDAAGGARANVALLGGLIAMTGIVSLAALKEAISDRLPVEVAAGNARAAVAGYDAAVVRLRRVTPAA
jgi:pyruvate ferredoxin oxidoreductase gamma subunit